MDSTHRPLWFWIVSALALLWNLVGLLMFCRDVTMTPEALALLPAEQQQIHAAMPRWVYAFFGISVLAGVAGGIGLLLKRRWAVPAFLVSLLGLIGDFGGLYVTTPMWETTGVGGAIFPLVLFVIAIGLLLLARKARARGWLD